MSGCCGSKLNDTPDVCRGSPVILFPSLLGTQMGILHSEDGWGPRGAAAEGDVDQPDPEPASAGGSPLVWLDLSKLFTMEKVGSLLVPASGLL